MSEQQLKKYSPFLCTIAEWELYDYARFSHEPPIKIIKDDVIIGVGKVFMDIDWYSQFSKLQWQMRADILAIMIAQMKEEWTFTIFEVPYDYGQQEDDYDC